MARRFIKRNCRWEADGQTLTLCYWSKSWWRWKTTHWEELDPLLVRKALYKFTDDAYYVNKRGEVVPWAPTRSKLSDLLEALSVLVLMPDDVEQSTWTDGRKTGPIVAVANGLLDINSRQLLPHSPRYFGIVSVPFAYDPNAPTPKKWLAFLHELWPDDKSNIDVLANGTAMSFPGSPSCTKSS